MKSKYEKNQNGYSLIELIVVVMIISIVAAIGFRNLYSGSQEVGGAERILEETAGRVVERRNEAIRLNGESRNSDYSGSAETVPLVIDFSDEALTASLIIEGDDDGDCADDVTGQAVTCLVDGETWRTAYRQDALTLPQNWTVATDATELGDIPLIGNGKNGRGILITQIAFSPNGRALVFDADRNHWSETPAEAYLGREPIFDQVPFWAIYFIGRRAGGEIGAASAVAIHPSGLVERFRFDGKNWIGFQNRTL